MCTVHTYQIVNLIVNSSAVICTILSLICVITNIAIEQSLRGILISFSTANVIGAGMFTFDTVIFMCSHGGERFDLIVNVSMALSLSHLMLLILHYYITLISTLRRRARDYVGLILTSWIVSAALGSLTVSTTYRKSRVAVVVVFLLIICFTLRNHFVVLKKRKKYKRIQLTYKKTFLRQDSRGSKVRNYWKLAYLSFILYAYIGCSILWLINEILEGLQEKSSHVVHSISVLLYSLNFYFTSSVFMHVSYKHWNSKQGNNEAEYPQETFRLRSSFLT